MQSKHAQACYIGTLRLCCLDAQNFIKSHANFKKKFGGLPSAAAGGAPRPPDNEGERYEKGERK
jgi:hypothetical protein